MITVCKNFKLSKNKSLEIQLDLFSNDDWKLFNFLISCSLKGDHAGFEIDISICKLFAFIFNIYDHRHWDWEKDRWEV